MNSTKTMQQSMTMMIDRHLVFRISKRIRNSANHDKENPTVYRFLACALALLTAFICADPSYGSEPRPDSTGQQELTIQETLGLVFYHMKVDARDYHIYRCANKGAKPSLMKLLNDKSQAFSHPTALRVLGYIADKDDIEPMIASVTKGMTEQGGGIHSMLDCLGIMAGRGIEEAAGKLKEMADPAWWKNTPYKLRTEVPGEETFITHELEGALWAVEGYALSGRKDVADLATKLVVSADRAPGWEYVAGMVRSDYFKTLYDRRLAAEKAPVSELERSYLVTLYTKHGAAFESVAGQGGALSEEEKGFVKAAATEALAAFAEMRDAVINGEFDRLKDRLLDNGKILRSERIAQIAVEFEKDLKREAAVFEALKEHNSTPGSFVVLRETTYHFPGIPAKGDIKANKVEIVSVTAKMSNSAEIGNMVFTQRPDDRTVADDGTLKVVMKKIDGKWYWNPFGW